MLATIGLVLLAVLLLVAFLVLAALCSRDPFWTGIVMGGFDACGHIVYAIGYVICLAFTSDT